MLKYTKTWAGRAERIDAFNAFGGDHHHFAGMYLAHKLSANNIQCTGFGAQSPPFTDFTKHQGAHAQRITHTDQLRLRHRHNGKRAFNPTQSVFHPLRDILLQTTGHQVDDALTVGGGLKN